MIFAVVGTQLSFDRMIRQVDEWAGRSGRTDIVAQVGWSDLKPRNIEFHGFIPPAQFARNLDAAELVIAHAGMGTILSALGLGKPIIVMPRLARLNEHRNDHQLATARRFKALGRIMVAMDEQELGARLDRFEFQPPSARIAPFATDELLARVRKFIEE